MHWRWKKILYLGKSCHTLCLNMDYDMAALESRSSGKMSRILLCTVQCFITANIHKVFPMDLNIYSMGFREPLLWMSGFSWFLFQTQNHFVSAWSNTRIFSYFLVNGHIWNIWVILYMIYFILITFFFLKYLPRICHLESFLPEITKEKIMFLLQMTNKMVLEGNEV